MCCNQGVTTCLVVVVYRSSIVVDFAAEADGDEEVLPEDFL